MKTPYFIVICCSIALAASIAVNAILGVQTKRQAQQIEHSQKVIDSLLNRRMKVFDVHLSVTDKSKFAIYGKYNKGTINVPNSRQYELILDSVNVNLK